MKRMNVREFRAKVSELHQEPIEVVRYSETVGYWIPVEMTAEPPKTTFRTKPVTKKWSAVVASKVATKEMLKSIKELEDKLEAIGEGVKIIRE